MDELRSRIDAAPYRSIVLDLEAVYEVDTEGADSLVRLRRDLEGRDVTLVLARTHAQVRDYLDRAGCLEALEPDSLFATVRDAVDSVAGDTRP
jgi:anti-anti-sigma regulatory factor